MLTFLKKKPGSILGIDINSTSVTILEVSNTRGEYCAEGYGRAQLSHNDVDSIAFCIKSLVSSAKLSSRQAVVAVPDSFTISKIIQISAHVHERDIEEWVLMESAKYIPYPFDEINLDFNLLGPSSNNPDRLDIRVVASRAENVAKRVEPVHRAGLVVRVVDVESFAIERAERFERMTFATPILRDRIEKDAPMLQVACGLALRR